MLDQAPQQLGVQVLLNRVGQGVNHLFAYCRKARVWRRAPLVPAANAATYRNPRIRIDPAVAATISAFVKARR